MMNLFPCCSVLLVLLSVGSVLGQPHGDFTARPRNDIQMLSSLLRRWDVRNELHVTPDQSAAIRHSRHVTDDLEAERKRKGPSLSPKEIEAFEDRIRAAKLTAALACLSPAQLERLEQLLIQYESLRHGLGQTLNKTLKLSDEQKVQIRDREAELGIELRDLMWDGYRRTQRELVALLNASQRSKWFQHVGEDFEFKSAFTGLTPLAGLTVNYILSPKVSALADNTMLLYRADVQKELELIDDQLDAARRGNEDADRKLREFAVRIEAARGDEVVKLTTEILAFQQQLIEEKAKARRELLLPHQERRLEELRWRYRSVVDPVQTFDEAVDLGDQQREQMLVKAEELCNKLTGELWAFQHSAGRDITQILTPAQRIDWSKKVGQEFKFESTTQNFQILRFLR